MWFWFLIVGFFGRGFWLVLFSYYCYWLVELVDVELGWFVFIYVFDVIY